MWVAGDNTIHILIQRASQDKIIIAIGTDGVWCRDAWSEDGEGAEKVKQVFSVFGGFGIFAHNVTARDNIAEFFKQVN